MAAGWDLTSSNENSDAESDYQKRSTSRKARLGHRTRQSIARARAAADGGPPCSRRPGFFTATDSRAKYEIIASPSREVHFFSHPRDHSARDYHHSCETAWGAVDGPLHDLSGKLLNAWDTGEEIIDLTDVVKFFQDLPCRVALVPGGQVIEASPLQRLAFDLLVEDRGREPTRWSIELGQPLSISRCDASWLDEDKIVWRGRELPFPLHNLFPTFEVFLREDCNLDALYPASLGVSGPSPGIVEELKAYRGLSDDAVTRLREFAAGDSEWV